MKKVILGVFILVPTLMLSSASAGGGSSNWTENRLWQFTTHTVHWASHLFGAGQLVDSSESRCDADVVKKYRLYGACGMVDVDGLRLHTRKNISTEYEYHSFKYWDHDDPYPQLWRGLHANDPRYYYPVYSAGTYRYHQDVVVDLVNYWDWDYYVPGQAPVETNVFSICYEYGSSSTRYERIYWVLANP